MRATFTHLLIAATLPAVAETKNNNLLRKPNVFGWQDNTSTYSRSGRAIHSCKTSPKCSVNPRSRKSSKAAVANASCKSSSSESASHPLNNIKIMQPRKKELWLPWPLGELRNDYYRFAEQQKQKQNLQSQQQRIKDYYSDPSRNSLIQHGREWAGRLIQRGQSLSRGITRSGEEEVKSSNYWIKETTTPMATASASMKEKRQIKKRNVRGGDTKEEKKWDNEIIMKYVKLQMKVRLRQLGYVGSDFSVHLPPASPALLLLYIIPSTQDPLRRLVKFSITGATLSWMHSEATKYRRFAPLPIMQGTNVRRPELLPFLPEELSKSDCDVITKEKAQIESNINNTHALWDPFQSFGTISSAYRNWLEGHSLRETRSHEQRRIATQSRLLEIVSSLNSTDASENSYALITGASRGIGRALAVELARYRIPLVLVARDIAKLNQVAQEIEKYYNVPCRVLQADLSSPDSASRIHAATKNAGLQIDILINNAGVCNQGEMIEGDIESTMNMIQVNVGSAVQLSRLYGKDMKERRRGRMLFVASIAGAMPGCASVGVYAATKAFEKSLAASLGREMEKYGVGVTCLLPGAVKDTDFASRSDVESAVCFQIPGYAKPPELVAGEGIKAMMLGYPEVYPGWENKLFAKILLTHLPSRVAGLVGDYAWSPWQLGMLPNNRKDDIIRKDEIKTSKIPPSAVSHSTWKFRRPNGNMLKLPELPKIQLPTAKQDDVLLSDISSVEPKLNTTSLSDEITNQIHDMKESMANITDELLECPSDTSMKHSKITELSKEESVLKVDGITGGETDFLAETESNETWYPSMLDQKQYDFRDRRLDY